MPLGGLIKPYDPFSSALSIAQTASAEADTRKKNQEVAELLQTMEARVKADNAESRFLEQNANVKTEMSEAVQETGGHTKLAVSQNEANVQQAKTAKKTSKQTADFTDLSGIVDQSTWNQRVLRLQEERYTKDEIEDIMGPLHLGYQPDFIAMKRQSLADIQASLTERQKTQIQAGATIEAAGINAAARLTAAQLQYKGLIESSRLKAQQAALTGSGITDVLPEVTMQNVLSRIIESSPRKSGFIAGITRTSGDLDTSLFKDEQLKAQAHEIALAVNTRMIADARRYDALLANGVVLEKLNPLNNVRRYIDDAIRDLGLVPQISTSDAEDPELAKLKTQLNEIAASPNSEQWKVIEDLEAQFGISRDEAITRILQLKQQEQAKRNGTVQQ